MKKIIFTGSAALATLLAAGLASAHTPLFACFDNGNGTIVCEGGFSDGSSAAGVAVVVKDNAGAIIKRGVLSGNSDIELTKPQGEYVVVFEGGDGHAIEIPGSQIFE